MTMTVTAAMSATATATTPPMIAPVLFVLVSGGHMLSMLSAWKTSEAGFESKGGIYHNSDCSGLIPVEKSMGVLSVVPATLVADTVSV